MPYIISFLSHLYSCISNDIPTRPWKRLFLPIQSATRIDPHSIPSSASSFIVCSALCFFYFRYKLYAVILKIPCELLKLSVSTQFSSIFRVSRHPIPAIKTFFPIQLRHIISSIDKASAISISASTITGVLPPKARFPMKINSFPVNANRNDNTKRDIFIKKAIFCVSLLFDMEDL